MFSRSDSDSLTQRRSESPLSRPAPWFTLFFTLGIVWDRFCPISYTSCGLLFVIVGLTLVWFGCLWGYLRSVRHQKTLADSFPSPSPANSSIDVTSTDSIQNYGCSDSYSNGRSSGRKLFGLALGERVRKIRLSGSVGWSVATMGMTLVAITFFGAVYHHHVFYRFAERDIGRLLPESEPTSVEGVVARSPRYFPAQTNFGKNYGTENSSFVLRGISAKDGDSDVLAMGNIQVFVFGRVAALRTGDRVRVVGMRQGPYPPLSFGDYDTMENAQANRTLASLQVSQPSGVQILSTDGDRTWRGRIDAVRNAGIRILRFHLDSQTYPVAEAILLGYRDDLSDETNDVFLQTGTIHLLSISGLHVGIFAAMLFAIGRLVRLPQGLSWLVTMLGVGGYIILTGAEPPAVRAGLFLLCFYVSQHPRCYGHRLEVWSIAFVVILLHDPNHLFRVGFLYSFLCVGTIFWMIRRQMEYETISEKLLRIEYERKLSPIRRLGIRWIRNLTQLILISGLLWFVSAGLTLAHFGQTAPCSILSNLPAIFAMTVFLWLSVAILFVGWLGTPAWLISCLVACDEAVLRFLTDFLQWIATLPGAFLRLPPPPWSWVLCFYAILFLLVIFPCLLKPIPIRLLSRFHKRGRTVAKVRPDELQAEPVSSHYSPESCVSYLFRPFFYWSYGTLLLLVCCLWGAILVFTPTSPQGLEIQMLSVGHGNATLVRTPSGRVILYDGGSLGNTEKTVQRILRAMWVWRERKIDTVIISHLDADHYNAIPTLCQNITIGEVCYGPLPLPTLPDGADTTTVEPNKTDAENRGSETVDSANRSDTRSTGLASIKDTGTIEKLRGLRRILETYAIPIRLITKDSEWWKEPGLTVCLWVFTEDAIRSSDRVDSSLIPELTSSNSNGIACYIRYDCEAIAFATGASSVSCEDSENKKDREDKTVKTVRTILLTGDLDGEAVTTLTDREPCGVEILAAPHHGSVKSCSDVLLAWTHPTTVIVSSSVSDYRVETEDFYRSISEQVWFTWREGTLYGLGTREGWKWSGWRRGDMNKSH